MFRLYFLRLSSVIVFCGFFVACGSNTRYSSGFKKKQFETVKIGQTTDDVYKKLGVPSYAWFSDDDTFQDVEYSAAPSRALVESKLEAPGKYAELRYSTPRLGTDHYILYYLVLKENVVIEKAGPVLQD